MFISAAEKRRCVLLHSHRTEFSRAMSVKPIELPPRSEGDEKESGSGQRGGLRTTEQISKELSACYLATSMCTVVGVGVGTALSVQRKNAKYLALGGMVK